MAGHEKTVKKLAEVIKPYGLTIVRTTKHRKIIAEDGSIVYSFANSPSRPYFCYNTLHALIKMGLVPASEEDKKRSLR